MKKTVLLTMALALVSVSHAQWGKRVKGNGKVVTEERSVGPYGAISLSGWFDVELVPGREGDITITGESNLLEHIITKVDGGNLQLKTEKGYNLSASWGQGVKITVPVESIDAVNLAGSGDINGTFTIRTGSFSARLAGSGDVQLSVSAQEVGASLSGSGDMTLSGDAGDLTVSVSGSGDVSAFGLEAESVTVNIAGSADVEVTARQSLKARVSGSGDIQYRGDPKKVDSKSTGSGSITKS